MYEYAQGGGRAGPPRDHRRRGRRGGLAGHDRVDDAAARDRGAGAARPTRRPRLVAVDRADAGRHARRDGRGGQRQERRPARGAHPRPRATRSCWPRWSSTKRTSRDQIQARTPRCRSASPIRFLNRRRVTRPCGRDRFSVETATRWRLLATCRAWPRAAREDRGDDAGHAREQHDDDERLGIAGSKVVMPWLVQRRHDAPTEEQSDHDPEQRAEQRDDHRLPTHGRSDLAT